MLLLLKIDPQFFIPSKFHPFKKKGINSQLTDLFVDILIILDFAIFSF